MHKDWKKILKHAWSVRLLALAAILSGFEAALPYLPAVLTVPPLLLSAVTILVVAAAFVARLVAQKEFKDAD